ncbi:MAG: class 1 fructose-bisphosphatase [Pseudomonadota bacterium]|nr:class 1 fructose-bisphosphatase [Pseudomonadota bacterium]
MSDSILDVDAIGGNQSVKSVILKIAEVAIFLSDVISLGDLRGSLFKSTGTNADGDDQKELDVIADRAYLEAMQQSEVRFYASEEQDEVLELNDSGAVALAIDPLDGSSNIDTNVSIGSIFSLRNISDGSDDDPHFKRNQFFGPGSEQIAAGYIIFGPQTLLVLTTGDGVQQFVLDREKRTFLLVRSRLNIPTNTHEYAVNASNYRHWSKPVRQYIEDSNAGEVGPRGSNFNMRWIASLVAETHRILTRGGIFIYPSDSRKKYRSGRLRMVYECAPIAFLVEQANGSATDCINRLLDLPVEALHARSPFAFGSSNEVARLQAYHDLPENETSPLFRRRGLFES